MTVPLLPDALWKLIEPLLPVPPPRPNGGRPRVPDRACLTGILFVLRRSTQDLNLIDAEKHQGAPNDIEPQRGDKRTTRGWNPSIVLLQSPYRNDLRTLSLLPSSLPETTLRISSGYGRAFIAILSSTVRPCAHASQRSARVRSLPASPYWHQPRGRPLRPHPHRRTDLRHDPLRKQRAPVVRATAIAPEPIASFRALDVRGSEGRSALERGSLAPPDPRALSENSRG